MVYRYSHRAKTPFYTVGEANEETNKDARTIQSALKKIKDGYKEKPKKRPEGKMGADEKNDIKERLKIMGLWKTRH